MKKTIFTCLIILMITLIVMTLIITLSGDSDTVTPVAVKTDPTPTPTPGIPEFTGYIEGLKDTRMGICFAVMSSYMHIPPDTYPTNTIFIHSITEIDCEDSKKLPHNYSLELHRIRYGKNSVTNTCFASFENSFKLPGSIYDKHLETVAKVPCEKLEAVFNPTKQNESVGNSNTNVSVNNQRDAKKGEMI